MTTTTTCTRLPAKRTVSVLDTEPEHIDHDDEMIEILTTFATRAIESILDSGAQSASWIVAQAPFAQSRVIDGFTFKAYHHRPDDELPPSDWPTAWIGQFERGKQSLMVFLVVEEMRGT